MCVCVCQLLSCVQLLQPHELQPTRLLCPWASPGKNTGVSCHALLQGIFLTQGSNPGLPHGRQFLQQLSHKGSPRFSINTANFQQLKGMGAFFNQKSLFAYLLLSQRYRFSSHLVLQCSNTFSYERGRAPSMYHQRWNQNLLGDHLTYDLELR